MKIGELCDDLEAERADLFVLLDTLGAQWLVSTPAPGWTVLDQVTHLAFFDSAAHRAISDPGRFRQERVEVLADVDAFVERIRASNHNRPGPEILNWLERTGPELVGAARAADPDIRIPWYGPDMTVASAITARIMETWAHGQDVYDALGLVRQPSPRLHHVAFIGARAMPFSFRAHGRPAPDVPVRVELDGWTFGPIDATNVVRGSMLDFCLVVTQRRHVDDTRLATEGPVAEEWLSIAQAFAGPPGGGRARGQFR